MVGDSSSELECEWWMTARPAHAQVFMPTVLWLRLVAPVVPVVVTGACLGLAALVCESFCSTAISTTRVQNRAFLHSSG